MFDRVPIILTIVSCLSFISCIHPLNDQEKIFKKLETEYTGISFSNKIEQSFDLNLLNYPFMYNGGGVAIGDIDNDGLSDIFFAGNMVSSKLYLNKGNMQFDDITLSAGVTTESWISGVSMVDINNDNYLDIYLSVVSPADASPEERKNILFINKGDQTFTESAAKFGIADTGFTTHSAFLDYNGDGLLDLYLLNHSPSTFYFDMVNIERNQNVESQAKSHDRLYRNNGDETFTDVSKEAGLLQKTGYGLGVTVSDFNNDGWPDIYVSNDITPNDVLYMNNGNGTFTDKLSDYLKHTSYAGMGVDAADFNNDGWQDILQVDMMPEDYKTRKLMSGATNFEHFRSMRQRDYHYYYSQNSLQLNRGIDNNGKLVFSEIGRLDGIAYTDWSWGTLFGDYDNDGLKDILITNGYPKAVNNYDYLTKMNTASRFGTEKAKSEKRYEILQDLPGIHLHNYLFENNGNLRFTDVSSEWGFDEPLYSYGVAHSDLDNNGTLDIVINNINAPAAIYQNNSAKLTQNHFLKVKLQGSSKNTGGIGTKVRLTSDGQRQYIYQAPWKGYQSTVDNVIHFGLGKSGRIDSLEIFWPEGRYQLLENLEADQLIKIDYANSTSYKPDEKITSAKQQWFQEKTKDVGLDYNHKENRFNDFNRQGLLPYQLSMLGPKLAVGDVTGNGLDDIYIGGASGFPGTLFIQHEDGTFKESIERQPWQTDRRYEDSGAVFFDANKDGKLDLYVTSGGYEHSPASDLLQDRLYINIGDGIFAKDRSALPQMLASTACVIPGDFNGDGQEDLFVGGRVVPGKYPYPARSYILQNDGGTFTDVTEDVAPELVQPGMITDAEWIDFNNDGKRDLVTVGEWLPIQFYKNIDGELKNVSSEMNLPPLSGWWNSLESGDFNNDGFQDLVAGNAGQNFTFSTSEEEKFGVTAGDFNDNMSSDIIFSINQERAEYPFFGKARLVHELQFIHNKFPTFETFAEAKVSEILGDNQTEDTVHYQVDTFASVYLMNRGDGTFETHELPAKAQLSAVNGIITHDVDSDGIQDVVLGGNIYRTDPNIPRLDAGTGLWLKGNKEGKFQPIDSSKNDFWALLDVKDLKLVNTPEGKGIIVANNSGPLHFFLIKDDK